MRPQYEKYHLDLLRKQCSSYLYLFTLLYLTLNDSRRDIFVVFVINDDNYFRNVRDLEHNNSTSQPSNGFIRRKYKFDSSIILVHELHFHYVVQWIISSHVLIHKNVIISYCELGHFYDRDRIMNGIIAFKSYISFAQIKSYLKQD